LSEAVKRLLESYRARERDVTKVLLLFGCLGPALELRRLLRELRTEEREEFEGLARKHDT